MSPIDDTRVVVEMTPEELDFLGEFHTQLLRYSGVEGSYSWSDVLEAYVRAREHYHLPSGVRLVLEPGLRG